MGETAEREDIPEKNTMGRKLEQFRTYYKIDEEDDHFRALRVHPQMGRNAARLYGRDMAIRSNLTLVAPKLPNKLAGKLSGTGVTDWHQDGNVPATCNSIGFWLALDVATPEMGTMRFYEGSQKLGQLTPPVIEWPAVHELPLSPPLSLEPGDATAHAQLMVHGAPENTSDRTRWGFIFSYFPAHAPYNGAAMRAAQGLELELGKPLDHPAFPLVYSPEGPAHH